MEYIGVAPNPRYKNILNHNQFSSSNSQKIDFMLLNRSQEENEYNMITFDFSVTFKAGSITKKIDDTVKFYKKFYMIMEEENKNKE
jgi:hypothetical protein